MSENFFDLKQFLNIEQDENRSMWHNGTEVVQIYDSRRVSTVKNREAVTAFADRNWKIYLYDINEILRKGRKVYLFAAGSKNVAKLCEVAMRLNLTEITVQFEQDVVYAFVLVGDE